MIMEKTVVINSRLHMPHLLHPKINLSMFSLGIISVGIILFQMFQSQDMKITLGAHSDCRQDQDCSLAKKRRGQNYFPVSTC